MTRPTLALAAFLSLIPPATASLAPRTTTPAPGKDLPPTTAKDRAFDLDKPAAAAPPAEPPEEKQNFVINDQTEVQLDGKVCKFEEVPPGASIVNLSVAADKKTILKIHFKSKK